MLDFGLRLSKKCGWKRTVKGASQVISTQIPARGRSTSGARLIAQRPASLSFRSVPAFYFDHKRQPSYRTSRARGLVLYAATWGMGRRGDPVANFLRFICRGSKTTFGFEGERAHGGPGEVTISGITVSYCYHRAYPDRVSERTGHRFVSSHQPRCHCDSCNRMLSQLQGHARCRADTSLLQYMQSRDPHFSMPYMTR